MKKENLLNKEPSNSAKIRRPRRSQADIDEIINEAAEKLIRKRGFFDTLVTDIIREAEIEPPVFYKRYKNIEDYYTQFVKKYDYWFGDIIREAMAGEDMMENVYNMLAALLSELSKDSIMLELLRWEVAQGNEITKYTSSLREEHTLPLAGKYLNHYFGTDVDIVAWSCLLISGIYFLCLHKDRATFCGIDINNPAHVERVKKALHAIVKQLAWLMDKESEKDKIADKMRKHGISEEIIKQCLT